MTDLRLPLPADLRARVLAASADARPPGKGLPEVPAISPADAFRRAAEALADLLCRLDPGQWQLPVLRDLDVQQLTGHLIGVERDVHRALAGEHDVADADHVRSTQRAALEEVGHPPQQTLTAWRAAVEQTLGVVAPRLTDPTPVALHGMRLPVGPLLVVRAFELWTHENDIRRAAGLPQRAPEPSVLQSMTALAVRALPHGMELAGVDSAALDLHLVLTGAGGGTWDLRLGAGVRSDVPVPEVLIVADAVGFCRLVANRASPAEVVLQVSGATSAATAVLAGAAALALD
jgi:uncharacterized protein (TIGR03083 family)